ncbi:MAG: hypothetical protein JO007_18170 [Alphaproteobacteria bacterium]|nr:hypothetical protein [Alphaproteobacteria bacterium]
MISRTDCNLDITSTKDHRLRQLKIGVATVGGDLLYSPPAHALAGLGLERQLVGYPADGGAGSAGQRGRIIDAVVRGDIDIAAVWGPLAGYFVQRAPVRLKVTVVGDTDEFSNRKAHFELLGLQYEISMGVQRGNDELRRQLDLAIGRARPSINAVLTDFGVPLIEPARLSAFVAPSRGIAD